MIERCNLIEHISRNTWGLNPTNTRLIYKGAIESGVLYGIQVWGEALEKVHNKRKLITVQKKAAIRICKAYRTSPTDALLVMAKLKPIHLVAKDIIWERNLIKENNQNKSEEQIRAEIKQGQLPNDEQLIKMIIENDTEDIDKTTIVANPADKETFKTNLTHDEASNKGKTIKIYTDGSKTDTGVGSGIVIKGNDGNTMYQASLKMAEYCTITQAETFAIYKAIEHISNNRSQYKGELSFYSDSQTALSILKTKNRKTKLTNELIENSENLQRKQNITYNWIPGHQGHEGNEKADQLAKMAAKTNNKKSTQGSQ
ncbi:ribonuclease H1-like [Centruroides vittatus]|uniref:ribonuclease H1-like n=1 Tax=Centruroides vittatus TaxID=120091 RepID=UPI00351000D0